MRQQVIANQIYTSAAALSLANGYVPLLGPANDGPLNEPMPITRTEDLVSRHGGGALVEWGAKYIDSKKLPIIAVRTDTDSESIFGTPTRTAGHGTSVVTVGGSSESEVNAVVEVLIHTGGTIGTGGITYQLSSNGGRTFGALTPLGTATSITVDLGGAQPLTINFAAGTLAANELITIQANVVARGTYGTLDTSNYPGGTNTAVASIDATVYPDNDYNVQVRFLTGGTLGTAGITYQWRTSDGATESDWSNVTALGTALYIIVPRTGSKYLFSESGQIIVNDSGAALIGNAGAKIILGTAGQTVGALSSLRVRTYGPNFTTSSVTAALTKLFLSKLDWRRAVLCGSLDYAMAQAIEEMFASSFRENVNGEKAWIGNARMPLDGETLQEYFTAMQTAWPTRDLNFGSVCYHCCKIVNALNGFVQKRPFAMVVGAELATVRPDVDISNTKRPGLACTLTDERGNPDCHDENVLPGPDDLGFITAIQQPDGVYVNNPRIFGPKGSAGNVDPMTVHRDIANVHVNVARNIMRKELSEGIFADKNAHISESDASRLEDLINRAEEETLKGMISSQRVTVSRDDDLSANPPTLTFTGEVQSKTYPKRMVFTEKMVAKLSTNR